MTTTAVKEVLLVRALESIFETVVNNICDNQCVKGQSLFT